MKKVSYIIALISIMFFSVHTLFADTVYLDELKKASEDTEIKFQNYTGPHSRIDSAGQIKGIGTSLGQNVEREPSEFTYFGKYRIIHAVDYSVNEGLDADIFIIEKSAGVDHIDNLRRMISGFLSAAYEYEPEQADMLAKFITVYNAVHRSDMDYFGATYKNVVTTHLVKEKAGLALEYSEWAGKTMIVIPLTPRAGEDVLADLDTDILTDDNVIEQLQTEDDKAIESRQDMVELKDQEVLEERDDIEQERAEIDKQQDALTDKKTELKEEAASLEEKKKSDDPVEVREAVKRKNEIEEEIKEVEKQEDELTEKDKALDERQQKVEEREEQIVEERKSIAEDQNKEIKKEKEEAESKTATTSSEKKLDSNTVPFLRISGDSGNYTGQLLKVDTNSGNVIGRSDIDTIRLRGYSYNKDEILSVAGDTGGTRIVSLVKIDPETFEVINSASVEVYIDSDVTISDNKYFAVIKDSVKWRIGIFDEDLKLLSRSQKDVFPATDIVVKGNYVYAQSVSGNIMKLDIEKDF
ncbi:MAG: P83/100 family protein [Spirochaetales bacterium]|nr:P83/100 family protein [Spirochaetales bacterium]